MKIPKEIYVIILSLKSKKILDLDIFYNYKIHIPTLEKQQEILAQIEPKEQLIELLKTNIEQAENQANQIMEQLFSKD